MGFVAKRFEENPYVLELNLKHWFRFDHLDAMDGMALLVGAVPNRDWFACEFINEVDDVDLIFGLDLLNGDEIKAFPESDDEDVSDDDIVPNQDREYFLDTARKRFKPYKSLHQRYMEYWHSGRHPDQTPLRYFVDWAFSKGIEPKWSDVAVKLGLIGTRAPVPSEHRAAAIMGTERNTLLIVIAALCEYSAIDHQGRGAATQISRLTDDIGAHVDDGTVRKWLKLIPDALEARQK